MIVITQGHELGIGLEVFLKSSSLFSQNEINNFLLVCFKETLLNNLKKINVSFSIDENTLTIFNKKIKCHFQSSQNRTQSLTCIYSGFEHCNSENFILFNLPTSKDQLDKHLGHTELLRHHFKNPFLPMSFASQNEYITLLTDHMPLLSVAPSISKELVEKKVAMAINGFNKYVTKIDSCIFSGINPHAGENGLLGHDEKTIDSAILSLKKMFLKTSFSGPHSGDTLHSKINSKNKQLFIYSHHDQGLAPFKKLNGIFGINLTFGLPFLRASVDHGTAFELFGKNEANFLGCHFSLQFLLNCLDNITESR